MEVSCRREVLQLHDFFAAWLIGELPDNPKVFVRLERVLAEDFRFVSPTGLVFDRGELLNQVRHANGTKPPDFDIRIERIQSRSIGPGLYVVIYDEWQSEAGATRVRRSSALFRERTGTPCGVEWIHVHETFLQAGVDGTPAT